MQGIYNYIPETNYVPRVYSVAPVLYLQYYVSYFHISTFRSTCAVPNIVLCNSFISCFPGIWFRYFLNVILIAIITTIKVLSFHCNQFCSPAPLFQSPYSSMSVIASFKQSVSTKMIRINDNSKLTRLQEINTGEWKNF